MSILFVDHVQYTMSLQFEWDPNKASANERKHGVTFEDAATIFADPLAAIFDDEDHSEDEAREIIIGHSALQVLMLVSFTEPTASFGSSAHGAQPNVSGEHMKRTDLSNTSDDLADDLHPEYDFDYSRAKPNRFAGHIQPGSRVVVLDPDIAEVFTTPEAVNKVLRALITTMPPTTSRS